MRRSARLAKKQGILEMPKAPFCPYKEGIFQAASHDNPGWCKYFYPPQEKDRASTTQDDLEEQGTSSNIAMKQDDPPPRRRSSRIQAKEEGDPEMCEYDKIRQRNIEVRQRKFQELQINEAKMAISSDVRKAKKNTSATNMQLSEPPRRSARLQAMALCSAPEDDKLVTPPNGGMRAVAQSYTSKMKVFIDGPKDPLCKDIPEGDFYSKDARMKPNREVNYPNIGRSHFRRNVEYREKKGRHGKREEIPPYKWDNECNVCGRKFSKRWNMNRHVREAHSTQKIQCPDCEQVFTREENLKTHQKTHHRSAPVFKCDICGKIFTHVGTLRRHEVQIHAEPRRKKCPDCPASYARMEKLEQHIRSGKHHIEYYCKCCRQKIIFKSVKAKNAHCREVKLEARTKSPRYRLTKKVVPEPITLLSCKNNPQPGGGRHGYYLSIYKKKLA